MEIIHFLDIFQYLLNVYPRKNASTNSRNFRSVIPVVVVVTRKHQSHAPAIVVVDCDLVVNMRSKYIYHLSDSQSACLFVHLLSVCSSLSVSSTVCLSVSVVIRFCTCLSTYLFINLCISFSTYLFMNLSIYLFMHLLICLQSNYISLY